MKTDTDINKIKVLRESGKTAKETSRLLGFSINRVNYLTSTYKLLTPELRMLIWKTKSPIKAQLRTRERRLKIKQKIKNLKFNQNLGYIVGCCFGDVYINKPKSYPTASMVLSTRNLSFAKYFLQSCKKLRLVVPRFREQLYDIKVLPNNRNYKNILFYNVSLSSIDFANFLIKTFDLNKQKLIRKINLRKFLTYGKKFCKGFLQGLYDSDGGIYITKRKNRPSLQISIVLYSSALCVLKTVQKILNLFEIKSSSICSYTSSSKKIAYRLIIYKKLDKIRFCKLIGFRVDYKREKIRKALQVLSIEPSNKILTASICEQYPSFSVKYGQSQKNSLLSLSKITE